MRIPTKRTRIAALLALAAIAGGTIALSTASAAVTPISVAAGTRHSCAVLADQTVKCWGDNRYGQLGDGTTTNRTTAVAVKGLTGATNVVVGSDFSCAIHGEFAVKCWGANDSGQLGNGTTTASKTPVTVLRTGTVIAIDQIAAGAKHVCVLAHPNTQTACWGSNAYGQLGDGTTTNRTSPKVIAVPFQPYRLAVGARHSCIATTKTACWGDNSFGQLGDGTFTQRLKPVVSTLTGNISTIGAGQYHTCVNVLPWPTPTTVPPTNPSTTGPTTTLVNGSTTTSPPKVTNAPTTTIPTSAIGDATTWCWGYNGSGQLASSTGAKIATPTKAPNVGMSLTSIGGGYLHTCGLTSSTYVFCWGSGAKGQLANPKLLQSTSPQWTYSGGHLQLSVGYNHSCTVVSNGIQCWGDNSSGQLGNGTTTPTATWGARVLGL